MSARSKSNPATHPSAPPAKLARKAPTPPSQAIFLPTLRPDPFGEASPELCWEWSLAPARLALRLTQFGWSASALSDGTPICHFTADSLQDLRESVADSPEIASSSFADLALPWVLAYEVAGF